jgi:hypothetical protein
MYIFFVIAIAYATFRLSTNGIHEAGWVYGLALFWVTAFKLVDYYKKGLENKTEN